MLILFVVLVIIASVVLGLIVLIQNPKGGGLSASLGGFSNQLMGVKQTTDVLEKGTWVFAAIVGLLCLASPAFMPKDGATNSKNDKTRQDLQVPAKTTASPAATPATVPMPGTKADTGKKP
jgi:preprotein translocase subunit SecG